MKRPSLSRRLTVRFSEIHFWRLQQIAEHEGTDAAAIIRHLVARFVASDLRTKTVDERGYAHD
ncbi:hypothetical protein [Oryzomonas rubra]|uniref:Ribbon-helix-helix protein, copG family n=1 Tax=Oryzomonas rubra TaxID=2509454 RepID=A0A5A9XUB4_9BACT|nr:hypothetical protein [Oryzomonas rubra]KAA0895181.1 hypothetical protein ET418_01280 [Oryzomonas rubra]